MGPARPAVFLDRDDTIIAARSLPPPPPPCAPGDVTDPALVRLLPGARESVGALAGAGFVPVIVTNQGGVARGGVPVEGVERVNDRLRELLGAPVPVYFCPFHPRGSAPGWTREHAWRKPGPGMILCAAQELGLDLSRSWLIGDSPRDIEAGAGAGIPADRCLLVGAGGPHADFGGAARFILAHGDRVTA